MILHTAKGAGGGGETGRKNRFLVIGNMKIIHAARRRRLEG